MGSWETVRELDLNWALIFAQSDLIARVYFGSPLPRYRNRILDLANERGLTLEAHQSFVLENPDGRAPAKLVTIEQLVFSGRNPLHSMLPKSLLLALVSDFYAPFRTGHLASILFPEDSYNPDTSPDKVFQLIRRLRTYLKPHIDAQVEATPDGYRLALAPGQGLYLPREWVELGDFTKGKIVPVVIRKHFAEAPFKTNELARVLDISARTTNRVLKDLAETGEVEQIGVGKASRFKLAG